MTMITPSYLGETIEYSSLHACRSTLEDPTFWRGQEEVDFTGKHYRVERAILHTPFPDFGRSRPEVYVSGHSEQAQRLACSLGTCWLRVVDTPENLRPLVARVRDVGIEVCLRLDLVCRETRAEAIRAVTALLPHDHAGRRQPPVVSKDDSLMYREATRVATDAEWLNETLGRSSAVLRPRVDLARGDTRGDCQGLPRLQVDRCHAIHHLGMPGARRDRHIRSGNRAPRPPGRSRPHGLMSD